NKSFTDFSDSLGLSEPSFSNGAAYGDLDNDGDLDLVVNNLNMESFIYRNNTDTLLSRNYLKVKFKGEGKNPFGIGAQVRVFIEGKQQVAQNFPARGFQSSVEPHLLFGIGSATTVDSLVVVWPTFQKQTLTNIKANQILTV